jgi:hypothetical protein
MKSFIIPDIFKVNKTISISRKKKSGKHLGDQTEGKLLDKT